MNPSSRLTRFLFLVVGMVFCPLATVMAINANVGTSSWVIFQQGLSRFTGITYGTASILVSMGVLLVTVVLGESFGIGTLYDIIMTGVLYDLFDRMGFVPVCHGVWSGLLMLTASQLLTAWGCCLYMGAGFGAGPRDGMFTAIVRRFPKAPISVIKWGIDGAILVLGWLMGGKLGWGTVFIILSGGISFQLVFRLCRFRPEAVHHENIRETFQALFRSRTPTPKQ